MTADEILGALELGDGPRRVLVIEDSLGWLLALTDFLESRGHFVTPMTGVLDVTSECVEGLGIDGTELVPCPSIGEIDVVFLDYNFAGGKHNGASFLQEFRLYSQALVFGMSSDVGCNSVLDRLGATVTMQKSRLKFLLRD